MATARLSLHRAESVVGWTAMSLGLASLSPFRRFDLTLVGGDPWREGLEPVPQHVVLEPQLEHRDPTRWSCPEERSR